MLNKYKNLKFLSRDRGQQYKALSSSYKHIVDGFHLLKNYTDSISKHLKSNLSNLIHIGVNTVASNKIEEKILDKKLSSAQISKINLIKEVQRIYKSTNNIKKTAEICNIDRKTAKKYIEMKNIKKESKYIRERHSYFDKYEDFISVRLKKGLSPKKIFDELIKLDNTLKYGTLRHYVRSMITNNCIARKSKVINITITRAQVNKYIFSWKLKSEISILIRDNIIPRNSELKAFKNFYRIFKLILKNHDSTSLKKLLKLKSKYVPIQKFIESLNKDYISVINTSKYKYNNSQVEGQVNKIKRIKHHMYGRAKIDILRNKAIYQSYFFDAK